MSVYKLKHSGLSISLSERDYIAEGGEGKVYAKGDTAYKIGSPIPDGKLTELAVLDRKFILAPQDIILSGSKPVGYTMPFVPQDECWQLPLLFTNTFWQRESVTLDKMLKLVQFMRDGFAFIHSKNILLVDANPYNFLSGRSLDKVYFIDVNSYATANYPATAIMACIRDRKSPKFTELSDWFSFAIVTFELLTGINPWRGGTCPGIDGDVEQRMIKRMDANISVLNKKVRFPKNAVRPFNTIPQNYLDWYFNIFENGGRSAPPNDFSNVAHVAKMATTRDSVKLLVKEIFAAEEEITYLRYIEGKQVVVTKNFIYVDGAKFVNNLPTKNLFFYNRQLHSIGPEVFNLVKQEKVDWTKYANLTMVNGVAYTRLNNSLHTLSVKEIAGRTLAVTSEIAKVMPNTTFMGDGFISHNIGSSNYFVCLPGDGTSYQIRAKELDGFQILDGKGFGRVAVVFAKKGNFIQKCKITFSKEMDSYEFEGEPSEIYNWQCILLDTGVLVETTVDGHLSLSRGSSRRIIEDDFLISEPYFLAQHNNSVIVARGNTVLQISLK